MGDRSHPRSGISYGVLKQMARLMRADGTPIRVIAQQLDVTNPAVSIWVRDVPGHREAARLNDRQRNDRNRVYPRGFSAYVGKLTRLGYSREERVRLVSEAAQSSIASGPPALRVERRGYA